ncbi:hypothetical protein MCUN1_000419 [Malassezia cuniculi]|uniref:Tetratricopeptide SHNi-TPR domain-containing protein n=1 Tax=Malassezia cuniculi TaxID=948313 RepID=A0AAF0ENI9_9BASI|nr:hypothetical protein MCUN1_000419 [Malassezia cuniculi]
MSTTREQLDEATRLFAHKQFEAASDLLADALESLREEHGEDAPVLAPVLHQYGRALLEHVIRVAGALGGSSEIKGSKQESRIEDIDADTSSKSLGKRKAKDEEQDEEQDDGQGSDGEEEQEEEEDGDDLGLAFIVLDLSRVIYERILGANGSSSSAGEAHKPELRTLTDELLDERALRIELADVHNDLGDVGLENENFEQASSDYGEALKILQDILPSHSRRLADAQLRLGLALEFHPEVERRADAEKHVRLARTVLNTRADILRKLSEGTTEDVPEELAKLSKEKVADELKDVDELIGELNVKLEEFRTAPPTTAHDAAGKSVNPALEQAIREAFLGVQAEAFSRKPEQPVNDLSTRVKKKRK